MEIERKSYPITELKADDERGVIDAYVSVFNNVDSGKEIVRPGFFTKSIQHKLPKGVWAHDWKQPIAKTLEAEEVLAGDPRLPASIKDLGGTRIKAQFNLDTQRGREAYSDIKKGIVDEFSIGYKVTKESKDDSTGARELLEGDWKEWSPVLVGMNPETSLVSIKSDEEKAVWSTAFQNNLPDSSFAYIESGGTKDKDGKTTPRSLRHFPYKDSNGKPDAAHVRNALARIPQSNVSQSAKDSALAKVRAAAKTLGIDVAKDYPEAEFKGMFEDVIEEREEDLYFLFNALCSAIYRAQMLDEMAEDTSGIFDLSAALDEILTEFSARVKASVVEEDTEEDSGSDDDMEEMANSSGFSFKGDLRGRLPFAKHAATVLGTAEVFAKKGDVLVRMLSELTERRKAIDELREVKAGAVYSAANLSSMQSVHNAIGQIHKNLGQAHSAMGAVIAKGKKPTKSDDLDSEALRAQSLRAQSNAIAALT